MSFFDEMGQVPPQGMPAQMQPQGMQMQPPGSAMAQPFADLGLQPRSMANQLLPDAAGPAGMVSQPQPSFMDHVHNLLRGLAGMGGNPAAPPSYGAGPGYGMPGQNLGMPTQNPWQQHLMQLSQALAPRPGMNGGTR